MSTGRLWRIAHSEASLGWGGQERRILTELTGFHSRHARVTLMAPEKSEIFRRANAEAISVVPINVHRLHLPFEAVRLTRWLKRNQVQVLNTHSSRDGYLLGLAGRMAGTPLLIRTRHIDVDYPNPRISRHAFTTFADHVLTTSQKITDRLRATFQLSAERITTLPTGIDLTAFIPRGGRAELGDVNAKNEEPWVGMVSVLRSWKGHPVFIEAARLLRERGVKAQFAIVGTGPQHNYIVRLIEENGMSEHIHLTGYREDVPGILRALGVLAIPSTGHEGIPQIGLQALACETPVVGSDAGGIPEVIRPGETGLIVPAGDAMQLANAIEAALVDSKITRHIAENGRRLVEQHHGQEHMLDRLENIYSSNLPELVEKRK